LREDLPAGIRYLADEFSHPTKFTTTGGLSKRASLFRSVRQINSPSSLPTVGRHTFALGKQARRHEDF